MAIAIANILAAMILVIANSYQYIALATRVYRFLVTTSLHGINTHHIAANWLGGTVQAPQHSKQSM